MKKLSPLAPGGFPDMPPVPGVSLAAACCGLRYAGRLDVFLASLAPGTRAAGVLTKSRTAAALSCSGSHVLVASTGVIGETLPDKRIRDSLESLRNSLAPHGWKEAAEAIMTTDTFPKGSWRKTRVGDAEVVVCGIAKGSGMIAPDMATMLAFVFTDAAVGAAALRRLLSRSADKSFNSITVDGDTSTNDAVLLFATGAAGHDPVVDASDPRLRRFRSALDEILLDLAHQIVRDGEGATKFVAVTVTGAASPRAARNVAFSIANSLLMKTAITGEDANWGRIVMAVGKAGEEADRDRLRISIGGVPVADKGRAVPGYDEAPVAAHMKGEEIDLEVDLGVGGGHSLGAATGVLLGDLRPRDGLWWLPRSPGSLPCWRRRGAPRQRRESLPRVARPVSA